MIPFPIAGQAIHPSQDLRSCLTSWWNQAQVRLSSNRSVGGQVFLAVDFFPLGMTRFGATSLVLQVALLQTASSPRAGEHLLPHPTAPALSQSHFAENAIA